MKNTEPKTPEELAAKARDEDYEIEMEFYRQLSVLRKLAEQCRPYMQHKQNCEMWLDHPTHYCTCGLDTVLNAMK